MLSLSTAVLRCVLCRNGRALAVPPTFVLLFASVCSLILPDLMHDHCPADRCDANEQLAVFNQIHERGMDGVSNMPLDWSSKGTPCAALCRVMWYLVFVFLCCQLEETTCGSPCARALTLLTTTTAAARVSERRCPTESGARRRALNRRLRNTHTYIHCQCASNQ